MSLFKHQILNAVVYHKRFTPKVYQFRYKIFNLLINLSNLETLKDQRINLNRFGLVSFYEKDYGPRDGSCLFTWCTQILKEYNLSRPHSLMLLTAPRILSFAFNPVSFFFAYNEKNDLYAVIADVNNTFQDHHFYLIEDKGKPLTNRSDLSTLEKKFFVSPFLKIEGSYHFKFSLSSSKIGVFIDYFIDKEKKFESFIAGKVALLTRRSRLNVLWRYPTQLFKVIVLIYYQGLKLWLKRIPYIKKPTPPHKILSSSKNSLTKHKPF